ncbi:MAG TPA: hypothetical protein VFJ16_27785 [Longimicrobium sp.]|nr:hypothetical protein [Longimicrobium sp.]
MSEEHPNIAGRDHRLQAITTLAAPYHSPSGVVHPLGTPVQIQGYVRVRSHLISTQFPSAPALYLSFARKTGAEGKRLAEQTLGLPRPADVGRTLHLNDETEERFFDALENLLSCVIFSYSALESFANEALPDDVEHLVLNRRTQVSEKYGKSEIERWLGLDTKLHEVLPSIFKVASPKGTALWRDYRALSSLRDRCIHLKSHDWRTPPKPADNLWSDLLAPMVPTLPSKAARLIAHYYATEQPRWLLKGGYL